MKQKIWEKLLKLQKKIIMRENLFEPGNVTNRLMFIETTDGKNVQNGLNFRR